MPITGTSVVIRTTLTNPITKEAEDAGEGTLSLLVTDPNGKQDTYHEEDIVHDGTGEYHRVVLGNVTGLWHYRWVVNGEVTDEGTFEMESEWVDGVDLTDLKVMVPRARRKVEGPWGNPINRPPLTDSELYAMVADATGDLVMLSAGWFHKELLVKKRDPLVGFPTEWRTDEPLTEWEVAVICAQLGLNYYTYLFRFLKASEEIQNEGTRWAWTLSPTLLRAYLDELKEERDRAIEGLRLNKPIIDRFASNIRIRDQATVAVLEWWDYNSPSITGGGLPGGQEASVVPWFPTQSDY